MKDLIIIGKAPISYSIKGLKKDDNEIWMLGTDDRTGGDLYFELHNIVINNHDNVMYLLPDEVYELGLPINNSICALLAYAYTKGFKNITIYGAPMDGKGEYLAQRPAVAYVCGWLRGKGLKVDWINGPVNTNYGKKK